MRQRGFRGAVASAGCIAAALAGVIFALNASAQSYPVRAVRLVVPYPPGGGNDLLGRPIARKLAEKWGQGVVVDNRGGSSGMVGATIVAKSPPDGYTILLCASPEVALNVTLYARMPYKPSRDFTPITQLASSPLVLTLHPALPARTVQEYIALAKKRPGELKYSTVGAGSPHHIAGEWMKLLAGINIVHVAYKGGGPQLMDIMDGHMQSGFVALPVVMPHVKSGKVRLAAVTTAKRSPAIPEVPSLGESGLAGFDVSQWYGVVVPTGTPGEIAARLNTDLIDVLKSPDIKSQMANLGADPVGSTAKQFDDFIRSEIAKYQKIVNTTKITVD